MSLQKLFSIPGMTLVCFLVCGCGSSPSWESSLKPTSTFTGYEGLPHQLREADLLAEEKKRADVTTIGGFPFYTPGVIAKAAQAPKFRKLLGDSSRYTLPNGVPRDCGPFHPDFAVEWKDGPQVHRFLVCFSCSEVRYLNGTSEENLDLRGNNDWKSLLSAFSSKRPAR